MTLDRLSLDGLSPGSTPKKVRFALVGDAAEMARPRLGEWYRFKARLGPPLGPVEPDGFDFRRRAYFEQLGGVGYTDQAPRRIEAPGASADRGWSAGVARLRDRIGEALRMREPGSVGAVMAALLVGDRSGLTPETVSALRDANLAHLLAISGMHMGMLCLTLFAGIRVLCALHPVTASAWPMKKAAAIAALLAGAAYLVLSGATVPTQRAFLMAAVAFSAILVDRPPVTMRAVALAASLILMWRPESLFDAGFQLSFAATLAMVAFYETTRPFWRARAVQRGRVVRFSTAVLALLATSLIAGLATGPFSAGIFNRVSLVGLPANLLAVPIMGLWVMPAGLVAGLLAPFGAEALPLRIMAGGVDIILGIAETASSVPGSASAVVAPPGGAVPLLSIGGLWLCLWRSDVRFFGCIPIVLSLALWHHSSRPDVLIAPGGRLIGVTSEIGRWVDRERGQSYAAQTWLRRDGEEPDQSLASTRLEAMRTAWGYTVPLPQGWRLKTVLKRQFSQRRQEELCTDRTVLVAPRMTLHLVRPSALPLSTVSSSLEGTGTPGCLWLDRKMLSELGPIALSWSAQPVSGGPSIAAVPRYGAWPWSQAQPVQPSKPE